MIAKSTIIFQNHYSMIGGNQTLQLRQSILPHGFEYHANGKVFFKAIDMQ